MSATQSTTEDADEDERIERAWVSQTPTTRLAGTVTDIVYSGDLSGDEKQNDTSFGIVLQDPEVVDGSLWVNQVKVDDGTTADGIDDDGPRPTDYRVVDEDDNSTTIANGALVTDETHGTYDEADGFDDDEILVWYNGMAGERIGRTLDTNGLPFADYTDDGSYLVKGLLQPAEGWRDARGDKRREMKDNGLAPRVARIPILRDDAADERVLIDISRYQGGRAYEAHVFDAAAFEDEFGSMDAPLVRNDSGYVEDSESEFEFQYNDGADDVLDEHEVSMRMFNGEGFADEPSGFEPSGSEAGGELVIEADTTGVTDEQIAEQYDTFVQTVVDALPDGQTPNGAFDGGLEGLIDSKSSWFHEVPEGETVEDIRADIYAQTEWLSVDDVQ
jgi:hypothetical protein